MRQLQCLTGLRGVAAYSVLMAHATAYAYPGAPIIPHYIHGLPYFGMSLFFVLSGFVIHYNYAGMFRTDGLAAGGKKFFIARFARLYPLYFVVLILSVAYGGGSEFTRDPWIALTCLTLTHSWLDFTSSVGDVGGFSWSVSTEAMLYVFFVFLILPIEKIRQPAVAMLVLTVGGFLALLLLFFNLSAVMEAIAPLVPQNKKVSFDAQRWLIYFSPYVRSLDFFLGVFASKVFLSLQDRPLRKPRTAFVIVTAMLGWCLLVIAWTPFAKSPLFQFFLQNLIFAPAIATALIFLCRYQTSWSRLFSHPALLVAGEISYSVYLLQIIAFLPFRGAFNVGPQDTSLAGLANGSLRLVFMLGAASMLGYGSYWLIERPARDYLRARLSSDARARARREAEDAGLNGTPTPAPQLARFQSAG